MVFQSGVLTFGKKNDGTNFLTICPMVFIRDKDMLPNAVQAEDFYFIYNVQKYFFFQAHKYLVHFIIEQ